MKNRFFYDSGDIGPRPIQRNEGFLVCLGKLISATYTCIIRPGLTRQSHTETYRPLFIRPSRLEDEPRVNDDSRSTRPYEDTR